MRPSEKCVHFIKEREALRLHAYRDSAGIPTIGYGTINVNGKPVKMGDVMTETEATKYLMVEVIEKSHYVDIVTKGVTLTQNQYDALVSFAYNAGVAALKTSTLIKKVRNNPNDTTMIPIGSVDSKAVLYFMNKNKINTINTIHMEFMKWVYITNPKTNEKEICVGLVNRRGMEYLIYKG